LLPVAVPLKSFLRSLVAKAVQDKKASEYSLLKPMEQNWLILVNVVKVPVLVHPSWFFFCSLVWGGRHGAQRIAI